MVRQMAVPSHRPGGDTLWSLLLAGGLSPFKAKPSVCLMVDTGQVATVPRGQTGED